MAAHLALLGFPVTLYNRTFKHIEVVKKRGGIDLESNESGACGFARVKSMTSNMGEALSDAEIIMVVVPSSAHADVAKAVAPHLKDKLWHQGSQHTQPPLFLKIYP